MTKAKNQKIILDVLKKFYPLTVSLDELSEYTNILKSNFYKYIEQDLSQLIEIYPRSDYFQTGKFHDKIEKQFNESKKILVYEHYTWSKENGKKRATKQKHIKLSNSYYQKVMF